MVYEILPSVQESRWMSPSNAHGCSYSVALACRVRVGYQNAKIVTRALVVSDDPVCINPGNNSLDTVSSLPRARNST